MNNGECIDGSCSCPTGYSGKTCDTHCSENVLGKYIASLPNLCGASEFIITNGASDSEVNVTFSTLTESNLLTGTLSANCSSVTIDQKEMNGVFLAIESGNINITGDIISVSITTEINTCSVIATKE